MKEFGGKMQRQHERSRPEQGRICWCGDPSCPGGKGGGGGGGFSATSAEDILEAKRRMAEEMVSMYASRMFSGGTFAFSPPAADSGPPASYASARKKVEKWLLTASRDADLDAVAGQERAVEAIREAIEDPLLRADLYSHYGLKPPRGVLLSGPPGCGKTMLARAAATRLRELRGEDSVEYALVNGPSIQSPYVGVTEETIRDLFAFAREYQKYRKHPLILFLDEADAILPDRTGRMRRVAPWEESNVAQFLAEMDGAQECGAFVILATNRPEAIDEALLRDGRCDRKIAVKRPDRAAAELILRRALSECPLSESLDVLVMAGVESVFDPHRVLQEGILVRGHMENGEPVVDSSRAIHLLMEHIVSGAMMVGVASRSKFCAFRRDREAGTVTGVTTRDVLEAVNEIYEENRGLSHSFAVQELKEQLMSEGPVHETQRPPSGRLN